MKAASIAAICHAVNAAYCASIGDTSQPAWASAPEWQKTSAIAGVEFKLANISATPEDMHASWLAAKVKAGWTFGEVKDADKKEHPCLVPYDQLPPEQRSKDYLFAAIVIACKDLPDEAMPAAPVPMLVSPAGQKFVSIKYIGKREVYREGTYGTGLVFAQGQSLLVPAGPAALMLRHPDVYVPGDADAAAGPAAVAPRKTDDSDEATQIARDTIAQMTKEGLAAYAKVQFRVDLDNKKRVGELRAEVTRMVDQFGVT